MIDLKVNEAQLKRTAKRAREKGIVVPTFREMRDPTLVSEKIQARLRRVGLWELHPQNLFRITWKNEPKPHGGLFGRVNTIEFPPELTGVEARIIALVGKWFPTGSHKVGATFGCLVPRLVTGQFDPTRDKAAWPSTGNFCRGGAYNANLLGCESIAILPEGMSRERFEWLAKVAGEVIATPGSESNVWEIFQKCKELKRTRENVVIFDQFEEFGNHLWHYDVTGHAMEEVLKEELGGGEYAGVVLTSGSAGTTGCADYLKEVYPQSKLAVAEPLQCPTLLENGFGSHRIEGIGDKHVPFIHNVRSTDLIIAIDDEDPIRMIRLFNESSGKAYLREQGVKEALVERLSLLGISGCANLLAAIKFAKFYDLPKDAIVLTVLTDSMELYQTRLQELDAEHGRYSETDAAVDHNRRVLGVGTDHVAELSFRERKRIHNLKYFTWVEQMGKDVKELNALWDDFPGFWNRLHGQVEEIDRLIEAFNDEVGIAESL